MPPARVGVSHDVFSVRRLQLASGRVDVLESWARSPLVDGTISSYRGRVFTVPMARIRVEGDSVEYRVRMSVPRQPTSEIYRLAGTWRPAGAERAEWEEGHTELSRYGRTPLNGRWEAMAAPGPESYPSAIVAFDASTDDVRVETPAYGEQNPGGVSLAWLHERACRSDIERLADLRTTRAELLDRFRAEGFTEGEAALAANREMQRLGLLPEAADARGPCAPPRRGGPRRVADVRRSRRRNAERRVPGHRRGDVRAHDAAGWMSCSPSLTPIPLDHRMHQSHSTAEAPCDRPHRASSARRRASTPGP